MLCSLEGLMGWDACDGINGTGRYRFMARFRVQSLLPNMPNYYQRARHHRIPLVLSSSLHSLLFTKLARVI